MSKFIYVVKQQQQDWQATEVEASRSRLSKALVCKEKNIQTFSSANLGLFVLNPAPNTQVNENLDYILTSPLHPDDHPYISISNKGNSIEASNDLLGIRVLWWYKDENVLILSSSQIAIVSYLRHFDPNPAAWTWMLSNGSLGPGLSWDKRIQALPAGATLQFDMAAWKLTISVKAWSFNKAPAKKAEKKLEMISLLQHIQSQADLKGVSTLLTLSGGYDSRAALFLLKEKNPAIHTSTWGIPSAFNTPFTDATVAQMVSDKWNTQHTAYNVQLDNDFETTLDIFLHQGEGRNDHINSFMDGLKMWQDISAKGYKWVVRADETFGWLPVRTELDARTSVALARFSDFNNIPASVIASLPEQIFPGILERGENELIEDYRDRLYQQYRLPFVIGPLQDPALAYVEFLNPLLHPSLIEFVRTLPPELRTAKKLYAEWVDTLLPEVPYAAVPAIPEAFNIAETGENTSLFNDFFHDKKASQLFGNEFTNFMLQNWRTKIHSSVKLRSSFSNKARKLLPVGLKKFVRNNVTGYQVRISSLALRSLIIYKMQEVLKKAAS